ncbi:cytochrome c oxidase assembly protein [Aurantiacibacter hainanensis]|uniref:cytochrome c oxidase assembly protein n=1 Tax=Aurantiacibacter hainanensis TaxID=3076114 RepID=UPI0030C76209
MTGPEIWIPYCGAAPVPAQWLARWNFDPALLLVLGSALGFCLVRPSSDRLVQWMRLGTLALTFLLFVSPFCVLGSALFSARTVHHILLVALLAPMAATALELHRHKLPGTFAQWTVAQAAVFWLWHAPPAYELALSSDLAFWAMQATIFGSAAVWFAHLRQQRAGTAVVGLLATMVSMGLLAALLTFGGAAFYAPHALTTSAWGLGPLEDQQIAGLIMWAPGSAIYLLAAVTILYRSLQPATAR